MNNNNENGNDNRLGANTTSTKPTTPGSSKLAKMREQRLIRDIFDREHELTTLKIREPEEIGYIQYLENKIHAYQSELNTIQNAYRLQQHN